MPSIFRSIEVEEHILRFRLQLVSSQINMSLPCFPTQPASLDNRIFGVKFSKIDRKLLKIIENQ